MHPRILYEDNHLIAVYKPAGVLVQGDKSGDISLFDEVKKLVKDKYDKPGNVFLGLIHRLDRNVDGVVLFAKTSKGASRLSEQFRDHTVEKTYHAWVHGIMKKDKGTLKNYLVHDENQNKTKVFTEVMPHSDYAELSYEVAKTEGDYSLVKVALMTGRHHQIRAQLSNIGHPIVGDHKYGSIIKLPEQRIALTATSLTFKLATSEERETVEIEIPTKPW